MIIQNDANAKSRRIMLIRQLEKLDKFRTPVALPNQAQHFPAEQINAGQQRYCAVPLVLMISSHAAVPTRYRRQIRRGIADGLNARLLVIAQYTHDFGRQARLAPQLDVPVNVQLCLSKIRKDLGGNELYCSPNSLLQCPQDLEPEVKARTKDRTQCDEKCEQP
jgi:hypothetical protein